MTLTDRVYDWILDGRLADAIAEVESRRAREAGTPDWDAASGIILFEQGDYEASEHQLRASLDRQPNDRALSIYALIVVAAGRSEALRPLLDGWGERHGIGVRQTVHLWMTSYGRDLSQSEVDDLLSALSAAERADCVARAGLLAHRRQKFRRARTLLRIAKSYGVTSEWRVYYLEALVALHAGRLRAAEIAIAEIDDRFEGVAEVPLLWGLLDRKRDNLKAALSFFKGCIEERPLWPQPRREAAWIAVQLGRHEEAESLLAALPPRARQHPETRAILVCSHFRRGKFLSGLRILRSRDTT